MAEQTGIIAVKSGDGLEVSRKTLQENLIAGEAFTNELDALFKKYARAEDDADPHDPNKMSVIDLLIMQSTYMGFAIGAFLLQDELPPEELIPEAARVSGGMLSIMLDNAVSANRMDASDDCDCDGCKVRRASDGINDNATVH